MKMSRKKKDLENRSGLIKEKSKARELKRSYKTPISLEEKQQNENNSEFNLFPDKFAFFFNEPFCARGTY